MQTFVSRSTFDRVDAINLIVLDDDDLQTLGLFLDRTTDQLKG